MKIVNLIFIVLLLVSIQSCTKEFGIGCVTSNETVETRVIDLEAFTKIDLQVPANLFIQEGTQFVEIEAPSDIIDLIIDKSEFNGEEWSIEMGDCYDGSQIKIWITLPQFIAIDISGSGNIMTTEVLTNVESLNLEIKGSGDMDIQLTDGEKLDIEIAGSGNINLNAANVVNHSYHINGSGDIVSNFGIGESCRSRIQGSGNVELTGTIVEQRIEIEGGGDVKAASLCSTICDITSKGSGNCDVKVTELLNIDIEGSGDICYIGQPTINSNIDGSGSVKNCN